MELSKRTEIAKQLNVIFEALEEFYAESLVMTAMLQALGVLDVEKAVQEKRREHDIQSKLNEKLKPYRGIREFLVSALQSEDGQLPPQDQKVQ
jgi:hypothetical protein